MEQTKVLIRGVECLFGDRVIVATADDDGNLIARKGRIAGELLDDLVPITFKKDTTPQLFSIRAVFPAYRYVQHPLGLMVGIMLAPSVEKDEW